MLTYFFFEGDISDAFEEDWTTLSRRYSKGGIEISDSPEEELSDEQGEAIERAYKSSRSAGKQKVRETIKSILEDRKKELNRRRESIDESLSSLIDEFQDAELQNADVRKKPLSEEAGQKAERLGRNIDLLKEYLSVSFEQMGAVVGMSRSSLHKIARKGRIPKITTLYQFGIGLGVPPIILISDSETLHDLNQLADLQPIESELESEVLTSTTREKDRILYGDPEKGEKDPGDWHPQYVVEDVVDHYESNAAILSAVIGWHHGGRYGAFLAAHVGHTMRRELAFEDLGGFRFPSAFVRKKIEQRMLESGISLDP